MNKEELLAEAIKRYPPGTLYWNLNMIGERSSKFKNSEPVTAPDFIEPFFKDDRLLLADGYGWVWVAGIWAEIQLPEVINNYELY